MARAEVGALRGQRVMRAIRNISTGPRGAYTADGSLVMVDAGKVALGDFSDINPEWFADEDGDKIVAIGLPEAVDEAAAGGNAAARVSPPDLDGDGKPGGSLPHDPPSLSGKTKAELIAIAAAEGVELEAGARVADIIAAIELAREGA